MTTGMVFDSKYDNATGEDIVEHCPYLHTFKGSIFNEILSQGTWRSITLCIVYEIQSSGVLLDDTRSVPRTFFNSIASNFQTNSQDMHNKQATKEPVCGTNTKQSILNHGEHQQIEKTRMPGTDGIRCLCCLCLLAG